MVGIPRNFLLEVNTLMRDHPFAEIDVALPGHPWSRAMGTASSFSENRATKWIDISSTVVVNWGNSLMRSSHALLRLSFKVMLYTSGDPGALVTSQSPSTTAP